MYYIIYKITNLCNGKYYIGKHQTNNIDDNYMGSGKLIQQAISKHGLENFHKDILFQFNNCIDMNVKEAELVNEDIVSSSDCYNIKLGGEGGFDHINGSDKEYYIAKSKKTIESWPAGKKLELYSKRAHRGTDNYWYGKHRQGESNPMYGKTHSTETKNKISQSKMGTKASDTTRLKLSKAHKLLWTEEAKSKRSVDYKNRGYQPPSQLGKKWWNNGSIQVRSFDIPTGDNWVPGRISFKK